MFNFLTIEIPNLIVIIYLDKHMLKLLWICFLLSFIPTNCRELDASFVQAKPAEFSYELSVEEEPLYSLQANFNFLNLDDTLSNYRGENVKIAVIDSGLDIDHQEFKDSNGNLVNISYDSAYVKRNVNTGVISFQTITDYGFSIIDDDNTQYNSHGTAVCGVIASRVNKVGITGIAPEVELMVLKTEYYIDQLKEGIIYAVDHGAKIINLSCVIYKSSYSAIDSYFTSAINYAKNKGVIIVAAAGNDSKTEKAYPAAYSDVIGVGALADGSGNLLASYSNYGIDNTTLVAPGTFYLPKNNAPDYYTKVSGTSFACPAVAAAIALFESKFPDATREQVIEKLLKSSDDLGDNQKFGNGRLNISRYLDQYPVTGVQLSEHELNLEVGEQYILEATVFPLNASNQEKLFISDDENIVTIDELTGEIEALSVGNTDVGVITDDGSFIDQCKINVVPKVIVTEVESITLNPDSLILKIGQKLQLIATILPENATNKEIFWSSSDSNVATIDSNGTITALKEGNATLTATTSNNKKDFCSLTVPKLETPQLIIDDSNFDYKIPFKNHLDASSLNIFYRDQYGKQRLLSSQEVTFTYDASRLGIQNLTIAYLDLSKTLEIFVTNKGAIEYDGTTNFFTPSQQAEAYSLFFISTTELGTFDSDAWAMLHEEFDFMIPASQELLLREDLNSFKSRYRKYVALGYLDFIDEELFENSSSDDTSSNSSFDSENIETSSDLTSATDSSLSSSSETSTSFNNFQNTSESNPQNSTTDPHNKNSFSLYIILLSVGTLSLLVLSLVLFIKKKK